MFRTKSSTQNPTLTQVDDVATTPSDACPPQPNSISFTDWVMVNIRKTKESRKQPSQPELPPTPPLKCKCGAKVDSQHIETIKVNQQKGTKISSRLKQRTFELPVEFEQVMRRRIDERIQLYAKRPDYQGPGKPLFDERVLSSGQTSTYFRTIDPTPGAKECCDKTGPYYKYIILAILAKDSVEELLPGLVDGMGKKFEWWLPACCPAGYVAQVRIKVNHELSTTFAYLTEEKDV